MAAINVTERMEDVSSWFQNIIESLKVKERLAKVVSFAKERPAAATVIGVAVATSFLPALAFVSFVVAVVIVGVATLLVFEGTAILMGGGLLLFALFGSLVATVVVGLAILCGLVAARFVWRLTAPLRAKLTERLGTNASNDDTPDTTTEKGLEMDNVSGFVSKPAKKVDTH